MLSALLATSVAALALQLAALRGMGRRRPIGDEHNYLARGEAEDPYAPRLFLRVPVLPWLAAVCLRGGPRQAGPRQAGERRLRGLMAFAAALTVAVTLAAGGRLGGPAVALLAALLLAAQPERVLLGCHIWPDTLLGLVLAALTAALTLPGSPAVALLAGGLCALGVLIRIDFLAALPLLLAAWGAGRGALPAADGALLAGPTLAALALLSLGNRRRYGIPLPDTTWAFNAALASSEAGAAGPDRAAIQPAVAAAAAGWKGLSPSQAIRRGLAALGCLLRSPRLFGRGIAGRLLTLAGPDTFVSQLLLPMDAAYPELGEGARRWWDAGLRLAFPLLVTVVLITSVTGARLPPAYAWPSLALLLPAALFHARTRYRVAAMPALCLVAAEGIAGQAGALADRPLAAALALGGGAALFWALSRIRCSAEVS